MEDYDNYINLKHNLSYEKGICEYILDVFTKSGKVISAEQLITQNKEFRVGNFLTLSDQMINSINSAKNSIMELSKRRDIQAIDMDDTKKRIPNSLFYISHYGGSKTQFFSYLIDELSSTNRKVLFIKFDDLNSIQPHIIYEQLISQIYKKIAMNSLLQYKINEEFKVSVEINFKSKKIKSKDLKLFQELKHTVLNTNVLSEFVVRAIDQEGKKYFENLVKLRFNPKIYVKKKDEKSRTADSDDIWDKMFQIYKKKV